MEHADIRQHLATLIAEATSGALAGDALASPAPLHELGLDSLGWLRLIDAVESAYGIDLDLGDLDLRRATVQQIVDRLAAG